MSADRPLKLTSEIAETVWDLRLAMLRLKTITACIAVCRMALRQGVKSSKDEQEQGKISEASDSVCLLYRQLTGDYAKTQVSILKYRVKIIQLKFAISCLHDAKISLPRPDGSSSDAQIPTEGSSRGTMLDTPDTRVTSGKALDADRNLVTDQSEAEEKVCAGDKTSAGDCVAALPNAAIDGVDAHHDNVGVEWAVSEDSRPHVEKRKGRQDCRTTRSCVTSLLRMVKSLTAFSPPPISGAISEKYFEEGQRCPSSLSALRNEAVGGGTPHHDSIGLGWRIGRTCRPRITRCLRGQNSTILRLQVAKCMGGHNSPTIKHRATQCMRDIIHRPSYSQVRPMNPILSYVSFLVRHNADLAVLDSLVVEKRLPLRSSREIATPSVARCGRELQFTHEKGSRQRWHDRPY